MGQQQPRRFHGSEGDQADCLLTTEWKNAGEKWTTHSEIILSDFLKDPNIGFCWGRIQQENTMKMVFAIIQPTRLRAVQEALYDAGVERITICDSTGFGRQKGHTALYRGVEYRSYLLRKITLEIAVNDDFLDRTIEIISKTAKTGPDGTIGDGKIFVLPMEEAIQIGPELRGPGAI